MGIRGEAVDGLRKTVGLRYDVGHYDVWGFGDTCEAALAMAEDTQERKRKERKERGEES